jgi:acetyltransferase-like isoleucine patch superfamily enzyme
MSRNPVNAVLAAPPILGDWRSAFEHGPLSRFLTRVANGAAQWQLRCRRAWQAAALISAACGSVFRRSLERLEWYHVGPEEYYRRRGARVGRNVALKLSTGLAEPHLCDFGNNIRFGPDVLLLHHDGAMVMLHRAGLTSAVNAVGKIVIHDNVFVGTRSIIMPNVEIGPNVIVAAGSVVIADVPANSVVGGVPARRICSLDDYLAKYNRPEHTLWIEDEPHIRDEVARYFMSEGHRGKMAICLRYGETPLTR